MNRQAFESFTTPWRGSLQQAAARIESPVATLLGQAPAYTYLAKPPYRRLETQQHPQPPEQVWCAYAHRDGSAFIITCPKTLSIWSDFDNVGALLGSLAELLLNDEPGHRSHQIETPDAFAYVAGPYAFVASAVIEWITSPARI